MIELANSTPARLLNSEEVAKILLPPEEYPDDLWEFVEGAIDQVTEYYFTLNPNVIMTSELIRYEMEQIPFHSNVGSDDEFTIPQKALTLELLEQIEFACIWRLPTYQMHPAMAGYELYLPLERIELNKFLDEFIQHLKAEVGIPTDHHLWFYENAGTEYFACDIDGLTGSVSYTFAIDGVLKIKAKPAADDTMSLSSHVQAQQLASAIKAQLGLGSIPMSGRLGPSTK
jgi:hypothetical protein